MDEFTRKNWNRRAKKAVCKGRRLVWKYKLMNSSDPDLQQDMWLLELDLEVLKKMMKTRKFTAKLPGPLKKLIRS